MYCRDVRVKCKKFLSGQLEVEIRFGAAVPESGSAMLQHKSNNSFKCGGIGRCSESANDPGCGIA